MEVKDEKKTKGGVNRKNWKKERRKKKLSVISSCIQPF